MLKSESTALQEEKKARSGGMTFVTEFRLAWVLSSNFVTLLILFLVFIQIMYLPTVQQEI